MLHRKPCVCVAVLVAVGVAVGTTVAVLVLVAVGEHVPVCDPVLTQGKRGCPDCANLAQCRETNTGP